MKAKKLQNIPVIVGGIIPDVDKKILLKQGVAKVYTPKDFELNRMIEEIATVALRARQGRR